MIYGLDELREKLIAQDADFDDRTVELLKLFALHEHPFLLKKPRLLVHLAGVNEEFVDLVAYYQHGADGFKISLPRAVCDDILSREKELHAWMRKAGKKNNLFDLDDHWVNFRRFSTRYNALEALKALSKQVERGLKPSLNTPEFRKMAGLLPRGSELPAWAKKNLNTVFEYAKKRGDDKAQQMLFEVRFGFELEDEWSENKDRKDIGVLWDLLRSLPVSNVDGNTKIASLNLDKGGGGGTYGNNTIDIGEQELSVREGFEDVLRHEVGHAVHEQREALVTPWLQKQFGWRLFPSNPAGIDQWVKLMGGWGALSPKERSDVTQFLRQAVGPGERWVSGKKPNPALNHAWWAKNFGPRLAFEKSGKEDWFNNFNTWHRVGSLAFALNYWYAEFMVVDVSALAIVSKLPDAYAAMSHFEFFAELYALYYDVDDPKRKLIPAEVGKWLDANIGKRDPKNPRRPMQRRKPNP